jgi:hypothetical protein
LETHLNYEIHKNICRASTILHFHHKDILEYAWYTPIKFTEDNLDQDDLFSRDNFPVPLVKARNVDIKDLAANIVKRLNDKRYIVS